MIETDVFGIDAFGYHSNKEFLKIDELAKRFGSLLAKCYGQTANTLEEQKYQVQSIAGADILIIVTLNNEPCAITASDVYTKENQP